MDVIQVGPSVVASADARECGSGVSTVDVLVVWRVATRELLMAD